MNFYCEEIKSDEMSTTSISIRTLDKLQIASFLCEQKLPILNAVVI